MIFTANKEALSWLLLCSEKMPCEFYDQGETSSPPLLPKNKTTRIIWVSLKQVLVLKHLASCFVQSQQPDSLWLQKTPLNGSSTIPLAHPHYPFQSRAPTLLSYF